jgi:hypothetical protein
MSDDQASFAAQVICLYLDDPDTPHMPTPADWDIAKGLAERGISLETIRLAFRLAFIRRRNSASETPLPPVKSLAYYRAVALNLTPEEQHPVYVEYVNRTYERLRDQQSEPATENRAESSESRAFS